MAINWCDVTTYGAVGNGSTDDTSAIQDAIDAAGAVAGSVVFFPAGRTYRTTGTLSAPCKYHTWLMYGATIWADFDGVAVRFGSFDASHENCSVYGGDIVRTTSLTTTDWTVGSIGIQWLNISRFHHVDYYLRGFHTGQQLLGAGEAIGECTISSANPGVVTAEDHGLANDTLICFNTTGTLPSPLTVNTPYYVQVIDQDTFYLSLTPSDPVDPGFVPIVTTGTQSGTHTVGKAFTFGAQYGHLVPRHIVSNFYGIHCTCRNGGWCNENAFFGAGRIGNYGNEVGPQSEGFMINLGRDALTPHLLNNNKFYGLSLENALPENDPDPKPKEVKRDAEFTLFDFCRYENFPEDFIDTSGADFAFGGNIFRGGVYLTSPDECLTPPTAGAYTFDGATASADGQGTLQLGIGSDLDAKLGIYNDSAAQKGLLLKQSEDATVPAIEAQNASGDPVLTVRKSQNGGATEGDVNVMVGDSGVTLTDFPGSTVTARGHIASSGAYSTTKAMGGVPGILTLGNDDGVVAGAGKFLAAIQASGNVTTISLDSVGARLVRADGDWEEGPPVIKPTRVIHVVGSDSDDSVRPYLDATSAGHLAFHGETPIERPTVIDPKDGNAALGSLIDKLTSLGLIFDSTTS